MTIEQLLGLSATELEHMTDVELEKVLSPHFCHTRPTEASRAAAKEKNEVHYNPKASAEKRSADLLMMLEKKFGIKAGE